MVFHNRSHICLGTNPGAISDVQVGESLHIAWIEDGSFKRDTFEITEIERDLQTDFKISNGNRELCLTTGVGVFFLIDTNVFEDRFSPAHPVHRVLGVSTSPDGLGLEMILTMLILGFSPAEAIDYTISKFSVSDIIWGNIRERGPTDRENRVKRIHDQLIQFEPGQPSDQ